MGTAWRPGKKGRKTRLWDNRVHGSVTVPPLSLRRSRWPSPYNDSPFRTAMPVPRGLAAIGATDFSRAAGSNAYYDPVQQAIRARNSKPPRHGDLKLPSGEPGWPFPVDWGKLLRGCDDDAG
jgi:hypothetical protein